MKKKKIKAAPEASDKTAQAKEASDTTAQAKEASDTTAQAKEPPARQLVRSTLIAAAIASALLVTAVLPAEYGVDPTGIGRVLGLTEMGETKMALAREEAAHATQEAASTSPTLAAQ